MVKRYVNLIVDKNLTQEELEKKYTNLTQTVDDIWYKTTKVFDAEDRNGETKMIRLELESLEGEELEKVLSLERKSDGIPLLNIPAYIYDMNENYKDITAIIPLQPGEQFAKYLIDDLNLYPDDIVYKEGHKERITYDDKYEEWNFSGYKWLVITREERDFGYAVGTYALKNLNNLYKCD